MRNFILGFLIAGLIAAGGFYIYTRGPTPGQGSAAQAEQKYHCPMHPTYISDRPGDCPICGMRLVPIGSGAASGSDSNQAESTGDTSQVPGYASVTIPSERQQIMGITTASVSRVDLDQTIRTVGRVTFDERLLHHIHTKFEGFIEELYVNYVGQQVKRGQPLFTVYSPELYATQQEYLLALRARESRVLRNSETGAGAIDLVAAARQRLALWDITENQLREVERTGNPIRALTIYSHASGVVTAKTAVQGLKVMPGDNLYDIADLSTVWVLADVYEATLPFVKVGQPAVVTLAYHPGKTWKGRVVFLDPLVDPNTRTVKARLEVANNSGALKPDMYAEVVITGKRGRGLGIPENAVIATGERYIVFVAKGDGVFEPREIVPGVRVRNLWEVKTGLEEGEVIVTGANFLLDSESKLKAAISGNSVQKHDHGS